jgi:predicted metal-dependent phosphoesterase TrpH
VRAHADLHSHSKFSDGKFSPRELIGMANSIDLGGLALTDHGTLDGLEEFMKCENPKDILRVSGVEIGTLHEGLEIHIIGYFVHKESGKLQSELERIRKARVIRFPKMVAKLDEMGIHVPSESIEEILQGVESPARPHLARLLVQHGFAKDMTEAFGKYLGKGKPAYVKRKRLDAIEAVELIKSSGAVPVIAHPLIINDSRVKPILETLREHGLEGVETEYDYTHLGLDVKTERIRRYANELNLVCTGGSDFHGDDERIQLGCVTVPIEVINELEMRRNT